MEQSDSSPEPASPRRLRADHIVLGPVLTPEQIIAHYSPAEWELLVRDWLETIRSDYVDVEKIAGGGDQGRDVVASTGALGSGAAWDNYQCKHYDRPLAPNEVWLELGKLCYYTFKQSFTIPRRYYFVAPQGVGTSLYNLIQNPENLRRGLIENWDRYCRTGIHNAQNPVPLATGLRGHVETFPFEIIGYIKPREIVKSLRSTNVYLERFGGRLPDRPRAAVPPPQPADNETRYVRQLLNAYGDCLNCTFSCPDDLEASVQHRRHFDRCREEFYEAEALNVFSRATLPPETFEDLQTEIYRGVVDVAESEHQHGFARVKATVLAARQLQIDSHPLISVLTTYDRSGICHQLANEDKLIWVPES